MQRGSTPKSPPHPPNGRELFQKWKTTAVILQLPARDRNFSRKGRWSENPQMVNELTVEEEENSVYWKQPSQQTLWWQRAALWHCTCLGHLLWTIQGDKSQWAGLEEKSLTSAQATEPYLWADKGSQIKEITDFRDRTQGQEELKMPHFLSFQVNTAGRAQKQQIWHNFFTKRKILNSDSQMLHSLHFQHQFQRQGVWTNNLCQLY